MLDTPNNWFHPSLSFLDFGAQNAGNLYVLAPGQIPRSKILRPLRGKFDRAYKIIQNRILSSTPALYHDLWSFVDQTNLPRIIESWYGRVVKSQIGSGQAMGPSKKMFPNHGLWNMAHVLGTENRTDSGPFPRKKLLEEGPASKEATFFHANFAHHKPGKVTSDHKPGKVSRDHTGRQPSFGQWDVSNKPTGLHGRKQQKMGQFHSDTWGLLRPKAFVQYLSDPASSYSRKRAISESQC